LLHGECWILYNVNAAYIYIFFVRRGLYLKKLLTLVLWITALAWTLILVVLALTPSLVISVLWHIFLLIYINIDIILISRYFINILSIVFENVISTRLYIDIVACVSERYNATSEWWIFFTELGELLVILVAIWFQITEINNWNWNWKILKLKLILTNLFTVNWNCNCNWNIWIRTTLDETVTEKSQLK